MPQYPVFTPPNANYLGPRVLPNGTIAVNAGPTDFSQMMMGWIPYALPSLQQIWGAGASAASAASAAPAVPAAPVTSTPRTTSAPKAPAPKATQTAPKAATAQPGRSSYEQMLIEPENPALYVRPSVPASASATPDIKLENPDVELPAGLADIINWFIKPSPAPTRSSYDQMLIEPEDPLAYAKLSTAVTAPETIQAPPTATAPQLNRSLYEQMLIAPEDPSAYTRLAAPAVTSNNTGSNKSTNTKAASTTPRSASTIPDINLAAGLGLVPPPNMQTTTSQRNVASVIPNVDLAAGLGLVPPSDLSNNGLSSLAALIPFGTRLTPPPPAPQPALGYNTRALPEAPIRMGATPEPIITPPPASQPALGYNTRALPEAPIRMGAASTPSEPIITPSAPQSAIAYNTRALPYNTTRALPEAPIRMGAAPTPSEVIVTPPPAPQPAIAYNTRALPSAPIRMGATPEVVVTPPPAPQPAIPYTTRALPEAPIRMGAAPTPSETIALPGPKSFGGTPVNPTRFPPSTPTGFRPSVTGVGGRSAFRFPFVRGLPATIGANVALSLLLSQLFPETANADPIQAMENILADPTVPEETKAFILQNADPYSIY